MKMLKRVFIGALCLAVLISCFAIFASAKEYTLDNFDDILEYYEEPIVFADDFEGYNEGDTYPTNIYNGSRNAAPILVKVDGTDKYLNLNPNATAPNTKDVYFYTDFEQSVDDFVISAIISGNAKTVTVWLSETSATAELINEEKDMPLVELHLGASTSAGQVKYYAYNPKTNVSELKTLEGITLNNTDKFELAIVYNNTSKTYSVTVTSVTDATNTATIDGIFGPTDAVKSVKIGGLTAQLKTKLNINIFDLAIYGGSYVRDFSAKATESDKALAAMYDVFASAESTDDAKLEVVTIAGKMAKLGYTTTDTTLLGKLNEMLAAGIDFYAVALERFALGFGVANDYKTRAAYIAKYADYFDLLPEDLSPVGEEKMARIQEIIDIYNQEKATLESYKTNSDGFIAALQGANADSVDYIYLKPIYDEAVKYYSGVYSGYPGIPEALRTYNKIAGVVELLMKNAATFITNVGIASSEESFAVRYEAYLKAKDSKVDNETYPGVTEALATFAGIRTEMVAVEAVAFEYLDYSTGALCALYIPAQEAYIALANAVENLQFDFPGVPEAKAAIAELEASIAAKKAAAQAYIDAVEALEGKTGAELDEAIAAAKALQAEGNILGIDGIEKANIALSSIESAISNSKGYATKFNNLVTEIGGIIVDGKITSSKETREVILSALAIASKADDSYAGVSNNKDILNKAIADYNAAVNAVNTAFGDVCGTATGVVLSAAKDNSVTALVGKVIAFIKELV